MPPVRSVHGKEYPKFLLNEVMPFINREYRTDPDPAKTGLGGSSYVAGIALYTVMRHPGRFGKLLLESPSLYAHDNYLLREADRFARWPDKVFIGVGSIGEPVDNVHRLEDTLRRQELGISRLLVVEQPGAAHNEDAWAQKAPPRIAIPVQPTNRQIGQHVGTSSPNAAMPQRIPNLCIRPVLVVLRGISVDRRTIEKVAMCSHRTYPVLLCHALVSRQFIRMWSS
jgi:pimeloyl-ACP methyl ester carboxylesterase